MEEPEEHREMGSEEIYDALLNYHSELETIPAEVHLFCPKLDDDDVTNYEDMVHDDEDGPTSAEKQERIKSFEGRQLAAYYLSLLMGISVDTVGSWLQEWVERTERFLTKCDSCVKNWHQYRGQFIRTLRECVHTPNPSPPSSTETGFLTDHILDIFEGKPAILWTRN